MSNIESLRSQFRSIRATLTKGSRRDWKKYEAKLLELDTPPTPIEWVQQIRKFAEERRLKWALHSWQINRLDHAAGWGEDINPSQIKGWSEALSPAQKAHLLEVQLLEDLYVQDSYEEWRADRDW